MHTQNMITPIMQQSRHQPNHPALTAATEHAVQTLSYQALTHKMQQFQAGLEHHQFRIRQRIILLFPISIDLYALVLAILASGLVVVFIDLNMGKKRVFSAIRKAKAHGIVSTPMFANIRWLFPHLWLLRYLTPTQLLYDARQPLKIAPCALTDMAIISFTCSATGPAKGITQTHGQLAAQQAALAKVWPLSTDKKVLTCFPTLMLHILRSGATAVISTHAAKTPRTLDPAFALTTYEQCHVSVLSAEPAYLHRMADYILLQHAQKRTQHIRQITVHATPASRMLCRKLLKAFPTAEIQILYGPTAFEPITYVRGQTIARNTGSGYLVGRFVPGVACLLIDPRQKHWPKQLPAIGTVGELWVHAEHVMHDYWDDPVATQHAKAIDPQHRRWHKTGDLAYFDKHHRLWLMGRISGQRLFGQ